jgi:hypothetical protein
MTYETRLTDIWKMAKKLRGSRSPTMLDRNPDIWLPGFASRIAPDFVPIQYHVPDGGGITKLGWLADAFTMDEFEGTLNQCNNSAPGPDGIKLIMFKFLPEESKRYLLGERILNFRTHTDCRLASMVFEKAGGRKIVWRYLQRMYRPLLKENSRRRRWQHSLIYRGRMTTS